MIKQLPKHVYDLIAAGEVVTAPLSVVKELVENSIDAGAARITIEMEEGGISYIRITDDGSGISASDIPLAFAPHATSKIDSAEDLSRVATLGFRGEALASIAAVSKLTILTRTEDAPAGTKAVSEGGSSPAQETAGAERGTQVTVENLFFNIPARRKHLNSARSEAAKIVDFVSRIAVCYPRVAIRLVSNGAVLFATRGNGDLISAIAAVYGTGVCANLIEVEAESEGMRLIGHVSGPGGMRKTRKSQVLFVNGRAVKSPVIESALDQAYREFAEPGRFPTTYLFLEVPQDSIDVNVHPAKSEVNFFEPSQVAAFVENTVREALVSARGIPKLRIPGRRQTDDTFRLRDPASDGGTRTNEVTLKSGAEPNTPNDPNTLNTKPVETHGGVEEILPRIDVLSELFETKGDGSFCPAHDAPDAADRPEPRSSDPRLEEPLAEYRANDKNHYYQAYFENAPLDIAQLKVLTSLFATYLFAADGDTLYIIDQHAAHERVNYERFLKQRAENGALKQELLTPYIFTLPAVVSPVDMESRLPALASLGYEIDEFGDNTWAARTFPAFISQGEAIDFLTEYLSAIPEIAGDKVGGETQFSHAAEERLIMRACKSSVKANHNLSSEEAEALMKSLSECTNPYTCPHGRPVFLKVTKSDIERMFKRA